MNALAHLSTSLFPALILILIFLDNRKRVVFGTTPYWFKGLNISVTAYFAVDIFYWTVGERYLQTVSEYVWGINIIYLIFEGAMAYFWLNYAYSQLLEERKVRRSGKKFYLTDVIYVLYLLLVVTAPWNGWMFSVNDAGILIKGPLYDVQYALGLAAALGATLLVMYGWYVAGTRERREEFGYLFLANMICFAAIFVQFIWREWWIAQSGIVVGILVIYINAQNRKITTDELTGLNNRREFDQYIQGKSEQAKEEWGMLMLDIDNFKKINDTYGHATGDEMLWRMSDILKHVAGTGTNFLARYGGDEFVVVADWKSGEEADALIAGLMQKVREESESKKKELPCSIYFSAGYALWSETTGGGVKELVEKADARMYENKRQKKLRG